MNDPIVVGTDGSPSADRAVQRAGELAQALGGEVHVVSSYQTHLAGGWAGAAAGVAVAELAAVEDARARAEEVVAAAKERLAQYDLDVRTHVRGDEPAQALVSVAADTRAHMIVVGNRGMSGARRVLGSVPNRVSHNSRVAVLIVPTS